MFCPTEVGVKRSQLSLQIFAIKIEVVKTGVVFITSALCTRHTERSLCVHHKHFLYHYCEKIFYGKDRGVNKTIYCFVLN